MSSDSPDLPEMDSESNGKGSDDLDALMEVLSSHRRRYALYYLRKQNDAITMEELASRIADWDSNVGVGTKDHILTELQHKHVPKMEAVGVVERNGDEVRCPDTDAPIDRYLDLASDIERQP
ncbi:DUF7344 domain-containing protein [Haladaptatus sp. DFWS20]|uniref:DUF7344 domain-containing protein n=1 Tax=Haladaptatus sp. DFWS20 TaxID=3403467 RepID=UPI003EBE2322